MREFLMLAHVYDPFKHRIGGWFASEKLDGQRCFWDGGCSRGKDTRTVPWANLDRKVKPVASGLWTRYGNVVAAPSDWLDQLPEGIFLDGELYNGELQGLRSIVAKDVPDEHMWEEVEYLVFDAPGNAIWQDDQINNVNFVKYIRMHECVNYCTQDQSFGGQFKSTIMELRESNLFNDVVQLHHQEQLPLNEDKAKEKLYGLMDEVLAKGGEGMIIRDPRSFWTPKRVNTLLKVKPLLDSEATVIGYTFGKDRLRGSLGALKVKWGLKVFDLGTGFTDAQRKLTPSDSQIAHANPGMFYKDTSIGHYPLNSLVSFKYVSLTKEGIPREGRFWRIREVE